MPIFPTKWTVRCLSAATLIAAACLISNPHASHAANSTATVTVNAGSVLTTIAPNAFGLNTNTWDQHLLDASIPGQLTQAGVTSLRFPGGSTSDAYHWQTGAGAINAADTFDAFMGVANKVGAQPIITVNYGSNIAGNGGGDPNEAAAWVKYANITHNYGIKYWEVGNEVYGNGTYANANWEEDLHPTKGPVEYANNFKLYAAAMKAADPSIKIGAVLTSPGDWPDGVSPDWDSNVLQTACSSIDFVSIHWYAWGPGNESDATLLSTPNTWLSTKIPTLRSRLTQYCGAHASQIQIMLTETNSVSYSPGKQTTNLPNALFLADVYGTWLEQGVTSLDWWDLHNSIDTGNNNSSSLYGSNNFGDYGILSTGNSSGGITEPAANTPFPPYYGLQMLTHLGKAGDQFVSASSSQSLVGVHAVKQANGDLAVLLINKDPNNSYDVQVSTAGFSANGTATVYSYGENSSAITSTSGNNYGNGFTQSVPPYSLTTIVLHQGPVPTATATVTGTPPTLTPTPIVPTATATTAVPAFADTVTVSPSTGSTSAPSAIHLSLTTSSASLTNGAVDIEVHDSANNMVGQQVFTGQNLSAGQTTGYDYAWTPPAAGAYTVKIGIFSGDWSVLYHWDNCAITYTSTGHAALAVIQSSTVSPSSVPVGTAANIHTIVTAQNDALTNGHVQIQIWDSSTTNWTLLSQQLFDNQSFTSGQSKGYDVSWTPQSLSPYTVSVGVYNSGWTQTYLWTANAAPINVIGGSAPAATATNTAVPPAPSATATKTPVAPSATSTAVPPAPSATPTKAPVIPTATSTAAPPAPSTTSTAVPVAPSSTATKVPVPPTATSTAVPAAPSATATLANGSTVSTATPTAVPCTAGNGGKAGNTKVGATLDSFDSNNLDAVQFTTGAAGGTTVSAAVYVGPTDVAPNNKFQVSIYADTANAPVGTPIATSLSGTLKANSWNTVPLTATLAGSTKYWLAYNTNGTNGSVNNLYLDESGLGADSPSVAFGTWPKNLVFGTGAWNFSMYVNYAACGAPATPVPPVATATPTGVPPVATATNTPVPPAATATNTAVPATATPVNTAVPPTATKVAPLPVLPTKTPAATPSLLQSTSASPAQIAVQGSTTIQTTISATAGNLVNGVVDIEVYNQSWAKVGQQFFTGQNIASGASQRYSYAWKAPAAAGRYTVMIGVFGPNWTPTYFWSSNAASIVVQ